MPAHLEFAQQKFDFERIAIKMMISWVQADKNLVLFSIRLEIQKFKRETEPTT